MAHSIDPAAGAVRGFVPARNDEERYLMRHIEDLADAAFSRGIARYSAFLSDREQDLARAALGRVGVRDGWRFDGGRAFAPLARGKPVKRQLLGILIGHNARVTHAPTPVSS